MKIEIKNLKHYPALSKETEAFSCRVYVNGRYSFDASNDGKGGCHRYEGDRSRVALAEEWARSLPPKVYEGVELPSDLDTVIDGLVYEALMAKELKAKMKNHIVYVDEGSGQVYFTGRGSMEHVVQDFGSESILNLMPFDEALKVYMGRAQSD